MHYKIGAKMITNRIKEIMNAVVGEEQSAFVPGRLITGNVVVAFESVHTMRRRKKGKNYTCAIKLDMMKAYDRVEWVFLEQMLKKLGFADRWIAMIMRCVTSTRFSVRLNGGVVGERSNFKIFLCTRKIMVMHSNERGECDLRALVDRQRKRLVDEIGRAHV